MGVNSSTGRGQVGQSLVGNGHWQARAMRASVSANHGKLMAAQGPGPAQSHRQVQVSLPRVDDNWNFPAVLLT